MTRNPDAPEAEAYPIDRALVAPSAPWSKHRSLGGNSACDRCEVTWHTDKGRQRRCWVCGRFGAKVPSGIAIPRWNRGLTVSGADRNAPVTHALFGLGY